MMLGAFVAYGLIAKWGVNYWVGGLIAIGITAVFGYFLDVAILRRVIGQPQFAVVMLTATLTMLGYLIADLLYAAVDPRIRF